MALIAKPIPTTNPSGAIICYDNLLTANITADTATIFPSKALIKNTYERYTPASGAMSVIYGMAALADVNYIAVAAHSLIGQSILFYTSPDNVTYTAVGALTPATNAPFIIKFDSVNVQYVKLTATLSTACEIGVIYAGTYMQMSRSLYGGHTPQSLNQKTKYQSSMSESGQFLGRSITRLGTEASYKWQFLEPDWYRETFQPFAQAARTSPFFISFRPDLYADEVSYVHTTDDISPTNMGGGHKLMAVDIKVIGHNDL